MQGVFAGLEVDGLGVGGHGGLLEGFGEGRVGVACAGNVFARGAVSVEMTLAPSCAKGWGKRATYSTAKVASAIISPALGPRMWTPRMRSVSASERNLTFIEISLCYSPAIEDLMFCEGKHTKPSVSKLVLARLLAEKGKVPSDN